MIGEERINWPGWETVKLIGHGAFSSVYEIQRKVFDDTEKAALKVISVPQNSGDIDEMYSDGYNDEYITSTFRDHLKNIVAEYSLMRKMNGSANVVSCDDFRYVQHDDGIGWDIFIKMELLTPLTKAIPVNVDEETAVRIAKDMCAALELCRKYDIIHRDIKPQNIFVSANGDYKLGDFGIAKTIEKTTGGTKIGTYKYMSPEVYNNRPYGYSADIYSLGLVLYWLLNERRMPFVPLPPEVPTASAEEMARRRRFMGEKLPPPAHGSKELQAIVLKACAYDPKDRFASAKEMREALLALGKNTGGVNPATIAKVTAERDDFRVGGNDAAAIPAAREYGEMEVAGERTAAAVYNVRTDGRAFVAAGYAREPKTVGNAGCEFASAESEEDIQPTIGVFSRPSANRRSPEGHNSMGIAGDIQQLIGAKPEYYVPRFQKMKSQNKPASWNWSAFLAAPYWMIYRKMYGYGAAFLGTAFILPLIGPIFLLFLFLAHVAIGIFGNYFYMKFLERKAVKAKSMRDASTHAHFIARNSGDQERDCNQYGGQDCTFERRADL